jgi:two-component system response regulator YesN
MDLLRTEYATDLSSAVIAARFGFSYAYLERVFRSTYHRSIHQELLRARVQAAAHGLRMGKPIKIVVHETGFRDYYYFLKVFKRITGVAPGAFQASHSPR